MSSYHLFITYLLRKSIKYTDTRQVTKKKRNQIYVSLSHTYESGGKTKLASPRRIPYAFRLYLLYAAYNAIYHIDVLEITSLYSYKL